MASSSKQQKRAKRAKTKAKQQRVQRQASHSSAGYFANHDAPSPAIQRAFADFHTGLTEYQPGQVLHPAVLEHFAEMQQAEANSLEDLLLTFLDGPFGAPLLDIDEELVDGKLRDLLSFYWAWSEGLDRETAEDRIDDPEFVIALAYTIMCINGEEPAVDFEAINEFMEEHYQALKQAEAISQEEMLKVFLEGPLLPDEEEMLELDDEEVAAHVSLSLIMYWDWSEGLSEDEALTRIASGQFQIDLNNAKKRIDDEMKAIFG
ncbi:hypothetical protein PS3A_40390 [Pseudomonas sp. 3A(2025)]